MACRSPLCWLPPPLQGSSVWQDLTQRAETWLWGDWSAKSPGHAGAHGEGHTAPHLCTGNRGLQIQGARGTARWNSTCAGCTRCMDGLSGVKQPKMQHRKPKTHEELQRGFEQRLQRMAGAAAADPGLILSFSRTCLYQERQNHNCQ